MKRFTWASLALMALVGCAPTGQAANLPSKATLYIFRTDPPALVEVSVDQKIVHEYPAAVPEGCTLENQYSPPQGRTLAIELSCSFGQAVAWFNADTGAITQPVRDSDSHFMAWMPDGKAAYLKVDSMNRPHIIRAWLDGKRENVPITELSYDISPKPGANDDFLFSFSRGLGLGSEMWSARFGGRIVKQVVADPHNYLSFARWSPDASRVAFIRIPDSATPFTVGELWVMQSDGSNARKLTDVDAGHGFVEAWSPDGQQIAFVARDNPGDALADQNAEALRSHISIVNVNNGGETALADLHNARTEAPAWSPNGKNIAFTAMVNDKMNVYVVNVESGQAQQVLSISACCPVWMPQ